MESGVPARVPDVQGMACCQKTREGVATALQGCAVEGRGAVAGVRGEGVVDPHEKQVQRPHVGPPAGCFVDGLLAHRKMLPPIRWGSLSDQHQKKREKGKGKRKGNAMGKGRGV